MGICGHCAPRPNSWTRSRAERVARLTVHPDDLDALGLLHNARYPAPAERARTALWAERGLVFEGAGVAAGDFRDAVEERRIMYDAPVNPPGAYAVYLRPDRLGTTGLTYGFCFCSADGGTAYARGARVLVRLDPATLRPAPWSEMFRTPGRELLRTRD
ncbi:acyl-CoA thioesterase [Streptomyces sp. NPDC058247]|uniref:acyl-CoA thioesterase n=1 Tax=Streptomyces sp. NPDC058247 TaxID=3346401 RepID=UPI0036EEA9A5